MPGQCTTSPHNAFKMAQQVCLCNSITGRTRPIDVTVFHSFRALTDFISRIWSIPAEQLLILLPDGVRTTTLEHIADILYVYDRRLFALPNAPDSKDFTALHFQAKNILQSMGIHHDGVPLQPYKAPLHDFKPVELSTSSLSGLLTTTLGWLSALEIDVHHFQNIYNEITQDIEHILHSLHAAYQYLSLYGQQISLLQDNQFKLLEQYDHSNFVKQWEQSMTVLHSLHNIQGSTLDQYVDRSTLEQAIVRLQQITVGLHQKLGTFKDSIATRKGLQRCISKNIDKLKVQYEKNLQITDTETQMADSFTRLVNTTRAECRNILDDDEINVDMVRKQSGVTSQLYTIAQFFYSRLEEMISLKGLLQRDVVITMGQIANVQLAFLDIKKKLMSSCDPDLDLFQKYKKKFTVVHEMPIIYGIYIIEMYRRQRYISQVSSQWHKLQLKIERIENEELSKREEWQEVFGEMVASFYDGVRMDTKLDIKDANIAEEERFKGTFAFLQNYLNELSQSSIPSSDVDNLRQNLSAVTHAQISLGSDMLEHNDNSTVSKYKARIRKLEALLHSSAYSNLAQWPTGIIDKRYTDMYSAPITDLSSSTFFEGTETSRIDELHKTVTSLQKQAQTLQDERLKMSKELEDSRKKLSDFNVERGAYRETLTNLNIELARLTLEQELTKKDHAKRDTEFTSEVKVIVHKTERLLQDLLEQKQKNDELTATNATLLNNISEMEETFRKEAQDYVNQIQALEMDIRALERGEVVDSAVQVEPETDAEYTPILEDMQAALFNLYSSNIFILENIGLLLSIDNDGVLHIRRVKGLRKGLEQSSILENEHIFDIDSKIKSLAFQKTKSVYNEAKLNNNLDLKKLFLEEVYKLNNGRLYETAVLKRFKDIEALAKRLTKETKSKKNVAEKLTLRSFEPGDLALFLPTKNDSLNNNEEEAGASSWNSSFSSVDLSTPPPFDIGKPVTATVKVQNSNVSGNTWAAFTAFDEKARFFLKNTKELTPDKEWFIGRIVNLQRFVVDNSGNNPYKLAKGTIWYQVAATVVASSA